MIPFILNNALLITPRKLILFFSPPRLPKERAVQLYSSQERGLTPQPSCATPFPNKFPLGRWLGPSSVLGHWWPSSRPKGLRKALFRLSSPWPTAGQLQVVTPYYTASDVLNAAQHTHVGVPAQRDGWSQGWSPQSSRRTESRSPSRSV